MTDTKLEEFAAFVRVAGKLEPSPCTARDGVEALRVAEAAARSLLEPTQARFRYRCSAGGRSRSSSERGE